MGLMDTIAKIRKTEIPTDVIASRGERDGGGCYNQMQSDSGRRPRAVRARPSVGFDAVQERVEGDVMDVISCLSSADRPLPTALVAACWRQTR